MDLMKNISEKKLRGAFYTPSTITEFILRWAIPKNSNYNILEPCCGDGVFLRQIQKNNHTYKSITAVEIDSTEAKKARGLNLSDTTVNTKDFYQYCNTSNDKFDLIVGNPPYIRYQYFDKDQRAIAEKIFLKMNLKYSKLMNPWVSFIVGSSMMLKKKGKIGFVIPAEILQVSYAKELRNFLAHFYNKIGIISFRRLVFPEAQQEVILLLCEKDDSKEHLIEHMDVDTDNDLQKIDVSEIQYPKKKIDFKSNKWTMYFLEQDEIDFIEKIMQDGKIRQMRDFVKVEVGITTGNNQFFSVSQSTVNKFELHKHVRPLVGRSVQVPSIIFTKSDWQSNVKNNAKAHLIVFPTRSKIKGKSLNYIKNAEKEKIQNSYKCNIRNEWQIVPSIWESDALFLRRSNIYPKFTLNSANALTSDSMHRVTLNKNKDILTNEKIKLKSFIASYYNSVSFAFTEICGRSYGGGVLELMPKEVENILIPYNENNDKIFAKIDTMMRNKTDIDEILRYTDDIILKKGFGFSDADIKIVNNIWKKLLNRRLHRTKK